MKAASDLFWRNAGPAYLAACLVLGGASAAGAVANAVLQGLAVLLVLALLWTGRAVFPAEARGLGWILLLFVAWALLSLVPLPHAFWSDLPMRADLAAAMARLGAPAASMPLSLSPQGTIASLLWLLPPVAMFLLAAAMTHQQRKLLPAVVIALAGLSMVLGIVQLIAGPQSGLRFYLITNNNHPVGFFANINHQATLLLCALPFLGYFAGRAALRKDRSRRTGGLILAGAAFLFIAAGLASAGSMAGYGIFFPAVFASVLIYRRSVGARMTLPWKLGMGAAILLLGAALLGPVSQQTLSDKFAENPSNRSILWKTSAEAIEASMPVGTGLGSFADVYRRYEDPYAVVNSFANHAHNDYLEVALELGVPGVLLVLAFLLWWAWRAAAAWRSDSEGAGLARAGSVAVAIVLLHSLVDYPLRTSAIAALFAMACALMVPGAVRARRRRSAGETAGPRHIEAV